MTGKKRFAAVIMCIMLVLSIFTASFYIVSRAHHECTGQDCPICHEIQLCVQFLNTVGGAAIIVVVAFFTVREFLIVLPLFDHVCQNNILVSLKVKLSD